MWKMWMASRSFIMRWMSNAKVLLRLGNCMLILLPSFWQGEQTRCADRLAERERLLNTWHF
jgi:hypothetical protein